MGELLDSCGKVCKIWREHIAGWIKACRIIGVCTFAGPERTSPTVVADQLGWYASYGRAIPMPPLFLVNNNRGDNSGDTFLQT